MTTVKDALELGKAYIEDAIEDQESGLADGVYEDHGLLKQRRADLKKIEAALASLAKIDAPLAKKAGRIGICVEGGIVQSVFTDDPSLKGIETIIVDYDTDGADTVMLVPQTDGLLEPACVHSETVADAGVGLAEMSASLAKNEIIDLADGEHFSAVPLPSRITERDDRGEYCIVAEAD